MPSLLLSFCLSVSLVCLTVTFTFSSPSVCLSITFSSPSVYLSVSLSVCLTVTFTFSTPSLSLFWNIYATLRKHYYASKNSIDCDVSFLCPECFNGFDIQIVRFDFLFFFFCFSISLFSLSFFYWLLLLLFRLTLLFMLPIRDINSCIHHALFCIIDSFVHCFCIFISVLLYAK